MKRHLLLLIGLIFSYFTTTVALTFFSGRNFLLSYPIDLITYIVKKLTNFESIDGKFYIFLFLMLILVAIPALAYDFFFDSDPFKKSKKIKYGYAKVASLSLIKKMGLNFEEGIILGLVRTKLLRKKHYIKTNNPLSTLIIAPSGTGKTAGFIIPTLLTIKNSIIALDIKGELFQKTGEARKLLGHKVLVFGLGGNLKFNPFAKNTVPKELHKLKPFVKNISNLIFDASSKEFSKNGGTSYFTNSAKELFNTIVLYLIAKNSYATIIGVQDTLLKDDKVVTSLKKIREDINDKISTEETIIGEENGENNKVNAILDLLYEIKRGLNQILQISNAEDQFSGVIGTLTTILSTFDDYDLREIINCEYSSINAEDFRKEKISLYLRVSDIDMERMRPIIKCLFETFVSNLISKEPSPSDNNITLILDEFGNLGRVSKLIKATTISRSYKLNQIFILQDLAQIEAIYSKEERGILEANTAYKVILQQNNLETAKRISEIIGNKTSVRTSKNEQDDAVKGSKSSFSSSYESVPLVTSQDILNLKRDQSIVVVQGFAANIILAEIPWYFKHKIK